MAQLTTDSNNPRKPLPALLLSLGATGLGHLYCGRPVKGLVLFFVSFAFAPVIVHSITYMASTFTLVAVLLSIAAYVAVFFYAAVDAWRLAARIKGDYTLREYNRWYLYLLFIIISISFPSNLHHTIMDRVMQAYRIPTCSMAPNIVKGDYIFLNKTAYLNQPPKVGDVVIFPNPNARHRQFIKRIIALPGDTLVISGGRLMINGSPQAYEKPDSRAWSAVSPQVTGDIFRETNGEVSYTVMFTHSSAAKYDTTRLVVPNGHCYVMGDNRLNAVDSRSFGPVPLADVEGRVDYIYLPAESWSRWGRYGEM